MKRTLLIPMVILCLASFNISGQTSVSGTISQNTTWTRSGSPYILTNNVGIAPGITLTIQPGVQVNGSFDLIVKGNLKEEGKPDSLITFYRTRILFKGTNLSNSHVSYVVFNEGGLQLADESEFTQDNPKNSGTLVLSQCKFTSNAYVYSKGYDSDGLLIVRNSEFENSGIKGFYPRSEIIKLYDCIIKNSTITSDSYNKGIYVLNSTISGSTFWVGCCDANYNIISSRLIDCALTGRESGSINLKRNIFINTSVNVDNDENGGYDVLAQIDSCIFVNYPTTDLRLFNSHSQGNVKINNSAFIGQSNTPLGTGVDNYNGSYIKNSLFINNSVGLVGSVTTMSGCNFFDNQAYDFVSNSRFATDARNNYWGTLSASEISNLIYDTDDDINLGPVDYSNYLSTPNTKAPVSIPANFFKSAADNAVTLTWNANKESDIDGYRLYYKSNGAFAFKNSIDVGKKTIFVSAALSMSDTVMITAYDYEANGINDQIEGHESWFSGPAQLHFQSNLTSGTNYCKSKTISYKVTPVAEFSTDNQFIMELSDTSGNFDNPSKLASVNSSTTCTLNASVPEGITYGIKYLVRVKSTNPISYGTPDSAIFFDSPAPTSSFSFPTLVCFNSEAHIYYSGNASSNAQYEWNFNNGNISQGSGQGPYSVTWNSPGDKYITLKVTENGCYSNTSNWIMVKDLPLPASICMVSTDNSNHNMIIWQQQDVQPVDSVIIYKETSQADEFSRIGSVSASGDPVFVDYLSNSQQNSSRYKIAVKDTCDFITAQSNPHRTIHLSINSGIGGAWNLIWNNYEGFDYSTYNLYRGISDNTLQKIAELPSNLFSYSDLTPPLGTTFYQIEIVKPEPCMFNSLKFSGNYISVKSNVVNSSMADESSSDAKAVKISPNPVRDFFRIDYKSTSECTVLITSIEGKELQQLHSAAGELVDMTSYDKGIYIIRIFLDNQIIDCKILKE
jgi:hypothetical protein